MPKELTPEFKAIQDKPTHAAYSSAAAQDAFNAITGGSYYGLQFFTVLRTDPEAYAAAVKLAERLRACGVHGTEK